MSSEISKDKKEEADSLVKEMCEKFIDGVIGIEKLLDLNINDLEWTVKRNGQSYQHKIYYERLPLGERKS